MKTVQTARARSLDNGRPLLENGDRMSQAEFHRRYKAHPGDEKFELVGGIVYMASPLRYPHATYHLKLGTLLDLYAIATPGVEGADNATTILGEESEPQPDLLLRIVQECGGQSRVGPEKYLEGAPELLAEIAHSSRSIDLNQKKEDYQKAGVLEYLVLSVEDEQLFWFHFPSSTSLLPDRQGVFQSLVFPGLWIHGEGLLALDAPKFHAILHKGLKSRGHSAFARRLEQTRRSS